MDSSVYCLPADLLGEGAERVVGTVRDRAGVPGVTVAACYHASRDIFPHNPAYRVASLAPGAFYPLAPPTPTTPLTPPLAPPMPPALLPAPRPYSWRAQSAPHTPITT